MIAEIVNHECFKKLFEVIPGAKRTIHIPIQFDMKTHDLKTDYWAILVMSKEKGAKTSNLLISYCPICGADLAPKGGES